MSACSTLRSLYIDFNNLGETAGKMLVVCAAGHKSLNVLDMEACDLTECVGRVSEPLTNYSVAMCACCMILLMNFLTVSVISVKDNW